MPNFEVDVAFTTREFDTVTLNDLEDKDEADFEARNYISDTNPDASSIEVLEVREVPAIG